MPRTFYNSGKDTLTKSGYVVLRLLPKYIRKHIKDILARSMSSKEKKRALKEYLLHVYNNENLTKRQRRSLRRFIKIEQDFCLFGRSDCTMCALCSECEEVSEKFCR
jgi:hypothetical protein